MSVLDEIMPNCGHKQRYVVSSDEGTNYCMECAYEGEIQRNNQLRVVLKEADEVIEYYVGNGSMVEVGKKYLEKRMKEREHE